MYLITKILTIIFIFILVFKTKIRFSWWWRIYLKWIISPTSSTKTIVLVEKLNLENRKLSPRWPITITFRAQIQLKKTQTRLDKIGSIMFVPIVELEFQERIRLTSNSSRFVFLTSSTRTRLQLDNIYINIIWMIW